jgi:hypothetical protein
MLFAAFYSWNFPCRMLFETFWSWNLPFCLPVATFGSWNLAFCLPVAPFDWALKPSILHDICIYLQHFGAGIFYLACYLQVVVGCWLLSISCGFLFVLLFLLQLKLL